MGHLSLDIEKPVLLVLLTAMLLLTSCISPPPQSSAAVLGEAELELISTVKRGKDYSVSGRSDLAEEAFRRALQLRPDVSSIYNDLAFSLQGQDRLEEAREYYQRGILRARDNVVLRENLARLLYQMEEYQLALSEYENLLRIIDSNDPLDIERHLGRSFQQGDRARIYRSMSVIYYSLGQFDEAICYSWLAQLLANSEYEVGQHVRMLLSLERIDPAHDALQAVVVARGGTVKSHIFLDYGLALFEQGNLPRSRMAFSRVLSDPSAERSERRAARLMHLGIADRLGEEEELETLRESIAELDETLCDKPSLERYWYWPSSSEQQLTRAFELVCENTA